jgi:hypothetical protein
MSKFTEAMNIVRKKNIVFGNTSFEQKSEDVLQLCDGGNRWSIDPSELGVIYVNENIGDISESQLVIGFAGNSSYIFILRYYELNEKKLNYLLDLKRNGCKKGLRRKLESRVS